MKKMIKKKFKYIIPLIFLGVFCNCDSGGEDPPPPQSGHIYFESAQINVDESDLGPVTATFIYSGPALPQSLTVNYTLSFPAQNAAKEGEDFILPTNSGSFVLPADQTTTEVTIIESLIDDDLFVGSRSVMFTLEPTGDLVLGKLNQPETKSVSVTIAENDFAVDKKFELSIEGNVFKIPYYSNTETVDQEDPKIKRVVVSMHGVDRNAFTYYENMLAAAQMETNVLDTLMIIAPQFIIEEDLAPNNLDNEHLYWSKGGWPIGNLSRNEPTNPRPTRTSSFAVMDSLLIRLSKNLPNLETVVLSGHSAGAQFANRYSAASPIAEQLSGQGIGIRFIVNNPSSYVYMDNKRRIAGTIDEFEIPPSDCATYNEYKYGLDDLPFYLETIGATTIRGRLEQREVVYLLGGSDNDIDNSTLDKSCEAQLQGQHRLERGTIYFNYLKNFYGTDITTMQTMDTVPGVGHNNLGMFRSELGRLYTYRKPLIGN